MANNNRIINKLAKIYSKRRRLSRYIKQTLKQIKFALISGQQIQLGF
jgi:hypothetical protein